MWKSVSAVAAPSETAAPIGTLAANHFRPIASESSVPGAVGIGAACAACDDLPRQRGHPVLGQHSYRRSLERVIGRAFDNERVANEFGMPLPLEAERPQGGGEMRAALGRRLDIVAATQSLTASQPTSRCAASQSSAR